MDKILKFRKMPIYIFLIFFTASISIFIAFEKKSAQALPPLVHLIPEGYFGPVFVLFGQKDGVEMMPDPLGQAVLVPENGIIKIKKDVDSILDEKKPDYQNMFWVSISKNGTRKKMIVNLNTMKDENWKSYEVYYDENGTPHKNYITSENFHYFSEKQKDEKMIFGHGECGQDNFRPENDKITKSPACGIFLIISPNAYLNLPDWMWMDAHHQYSSVQQLVEESNQRLKKKKIFYKIQ